MRCVCLWLAVLLAGCASAPIRRDAAASLAAADARVLDGCYDCLLEARAIYEKVAVGRARPLVVGRLFETELLLAMREKSLSLPWQPTLERASALIQEVPPAMDPARLMEIVAALAVEPVGTPVVDRRAHLTAHRPFDARVDSLLGWLDAAPLTPAVRRTLAVALDCSYPVRTPPPGSRRTPSSGRPARSPVDPPLVAYEIATCRTPRRADLEALRTALPAFIETSFGIARVSLLTAKDDGAPDARERLTELHARFPDSSGVTYLFGNYSQLVGDCRAALGYYEATLALREAHEDAMLGRAICLSYLKRHDEAIAAATRMVDRRTYNLDQAYYWRAWNHHVLKDLPTARQDIESAKKIAANGEIFTLAGMIEHDQDDLPVADRDLKAARAAAYGTRNCTAAWYLGLVKMKQEQWLESSNWFESAMECYEQNLAESDAGLKAMEARTDLDPDFRTRQIAGFQAALKEDRGQYHAAAFNAANQGARAGRIDRARTLLEIAARDPALDSLVQQLRAIIKSPVPRRRSP